MRGNKGSEVTEHHGAAVGGGEVGLLRVRTTSNTSRLAASNAVMIMKMANFRGLQDGAPRQAERSWCVSSLPALLRTPRKYTAPGQIRARRLLPAPSPPRFALHGRRVKSTQPESAAMR